MTRALALILMLMPGCRGCTSQPPETELVVLAASSLTNVFAELADRFEATHPGVHVVLATAGSQALRLQIESGAPADVFASADDAHVDALRSQGLIALDAPFASSSLVVVVPTGSTAVRTFEDLPRAQNIVLGADSVPVGRYTRELLARADGRWPGFRDRVTARVASREPNVRLVLAKITLGEADAAVVYRTDAIVAGDRVRAVPIPPELGPLATYRAAALAHAPQPALAAELLDLLASPEGQRILADHGFSPPPTAEAP